VTEPIFIGVVVDLMSLGSFYCILLLCYNFITILVMKYSAVIVIWLCLDRPYSTIYLHTQLYGPKNVVVVQF